MMISGTTGDLCFKEMRWESRGIGNQLEYAMSTSKSNQLVHILRRDLVSLHLLNVERCESLLPQFIWEICQCPANDKSRHSKSAGY